MNGQGFFGKYRGVVSTIEDPLLLGRIQARVPDVFGDQPSGWAMPCAAFAGHGMGFVALPAIGAGVWIEFEHGDPDYPIWSGCWWGAAPEVPSTALDPPYKKLVLKTTGGHTIVADDTPGEGGITLQTLEGQKVVMTSTGITIDSGQGATIKLQGPEVTISGATITLSGDGGSSVALSGPQVSVNNGALEVT